MVHYDVYLKFLNYFREVTWLRLSPKLPSVSTGLNSWLGSLTFKPLVLFLSWASLIAWLWSLSKNSRGFNGGGSSSGGGGGGGGNLVRGEFRSNDLSSSSVDLSSWSLSELLLSRRLMPWRCGSRNVAFL